MNKKCWKSKIILITAITILFSGAYASADRGKGYGHYPGKHHWGYGGPGCGAFDDLSEDQIKQLDAERTAFFEATKKLRRQIYQKQLELASELAKEDPNAETAAGLQKEISDFKAQMAQKRLEHILRVRQINPDLARGFLGGRLRGPGMMGPKWGAFDCPFGGPQGRYGMGPGMMHRGMRGPGGEGSWGPSDCPFGGPGGGWERGPKMMGPRGGYHMGPGWAGRDCPRQDVGQGSQAE